MDAPPVALKLDSTLSLSSKKVVGYRETFVLAVRRTGTSARKVTITAKPVDRAERVVGTIRLNKAGRGELKVSANRTTRFTASVGGDATEEDDYEEVVDDNVIIKAGQDRATLQIQNA